MNNKKKILFWGELPPEAVHGISLSNERILDSLSLDYQVIKVIDRASFGGVVRKIFSLIVSLLMLTFYATKKCNYFYINTPMSTLGLWKIYLAVRLVLFVSPKTQVISHLHRGDFLAFIANGNNRALFSKFSNYVHRLLVLSNKSKREIIENDLFDAESVCVLFNTIEPINRPKEATDSCDKERYLYCLCNYIETKRIHSLVKISNQLLYPVKFNGVASSEHYMKKLVQLDAAHLCSLDDVIHGNEKERKLRGAKALVLPSLNEGMPLVLLESLAQGTPVICFDVGYIADYLGEDYPGLVRELTDEALTSRLQWLEEFSEAEYLALRDRSFKLFWDNFDPNTIRSHTLQLFSSFNG
ncbi:glycosyltransferase family 4 protein [Vibrio sp. A11]|uniref:glycosyltransferase family 4 protein n=1 Tax=Vibrio sp. A11 TaxID=2591464 RepID=UPI001482551A|nr:glycosyltransferase family 4 protein [Vibrio sp. A11]NNN61206.1 glycosyltransferase family 4 protein [Vibrio sp. A11]